MSENISEADILARAQEKFHEYQSVLNVRLGYVFENGWITDQRALVVTVFNPAAVSQQDASSIPPSFEGYPVQISGPTLEELLVLATGASPETFTREARGVKYVPPKGVKLKTITDTMKIVAHVSPEKGWKNLQEFLEPTRRTLTVGMFDFGAPHIQASIKALGEKSSFKKMVLAIQKGSSTGEGTKKDDITDKEMIEDLSGNLGDRFESAWVKTGKVNGWVPTSYHIKVAVRDHQSIWLSSGNWQTSNQPDLELLENASQNHLLQTYNREWHVILHHEEIAEAYEAFILNDFEHNKEMLERESLVEEPYFLVPEIDLLTREAARTFKTFEEFSAEREFTVTPLLSPDNYFEEVLELVQSAESELLIQNQTFNAPGEGSSKLQEMMQAVLQRQEEGVDVKIIFRNFMPSVTRKNLEALVDMGFKPSSIRMHSKCHTKGIVVDGKRVLIGSQNWSNDGVAANRDASLLFDDEELAVYFREIFMHDWDNLAKQNIGPQNFEVKIEKGRKEIPEGMTMISLSEAESMV